MKNRPYRMVENDLCKVKAENQISYSKKLHLRTIYFVDSKARLKKNNPVLNKEKVRLLPLPFFLEYLILKQFLK